MVLRGAGGKGARRASHFDDDGRVHRARDESEEPREKLALYVAENAYVTLMALLALISLAPQWARWVGH